MFRFCELWRRGEKRRRRKKRTSASDKERQPQNKKKKRRENTNKVESCFIFRLAKSPSVSSSSIFLQVTKVSEKEEQETKRKEEKKKKQTLKKWGLMGSPARADLTASLKRLTVLVVFVFEGW